MDFIAHYTSKDFVRTVNWALSIHAFSLRMIMLFSFFVNEEMIYKKKFEFFRKFLFFLLFGSFKIYNKIWDQIYLMYNKGKGFIIFWVLIIFFHIILQIILQIYITYVKRVSLASKNENAPTNRYAIVNFWENRSC